MFVVGFTYNAISLSRMNWVITLPEPAGVGASAAFLPELNGGGPARTIEGGMDQLEAAGTWVKTKAAKRGTCW
jgi:hypothetical protein